MLALTDYNEEGTQRDNLGWALLMIALFTVGINFIKAIIFDTKNLIFWLIK